MEAEIQLFDPTPTAKSVFVLQIPAGYPQPACEDMYRSWKEHFAAKGYEKPPILIMVAADLTLESLTDEQLKTAGLMRIPDAVEKVE